MNMVQMKTIKLSCLEQQMLLQCFYASRRSRTTRPFEGLNSRKNSTLSLRRLNHLSKLLSPWTNQSNAGRTKAIKFPYSMLWNLWTKLYDGRAVEIKKKLICNDEQLGEKVSIQPQALFGLVYSLVWLCLDWFVLKPCLLPHYRQNCGTVSSTSGDHSGKTLNSLQWRIGSRIQSAKLLCFSRLSK